MSHADRSICSQEVYSFRQPQFYASEDSCPGYRALMAQQTDESVCGKRAGSRQVCCLRWLLLGGGGRPSVLLGMFRVFCDNYMR